MSASLRDLVARAQAARGTGETLVLATIIATNGSTYRKAGARMLFARDGSATGLLAGGSFERELFAHALPLFDGAAPCSVELDTPGRGDAAGGAGFERDGSARILLQRLDAACDYRPLSLLAAAFARQQRHVLITICSSTDPGLAAGSSYLDGPDEIADVPAELREEIQATAAAAGAALLVNHLYASGEVEVFYAPVVPPLALLLAGATPDAVPVAVLARLLGWQVEIADARGDCSGGALPRELPLHDAPASQLAGRIDLGRFDAAVLLTRNFELDRDYLAVLAASAVPYIGLLGSRNRTARLRDALGAVAAQLGERLHAPVGLDLGADTPEEIALAIVAQVQQQHALCARAAATAAQERARIRERVHAVVLAAGGSKRFGGFKQLLEFGGESLLKRTCRLASAACAGRALVVHGPKPTKTQREVADIEIRNVINTRWESGIASSLRAGIAALPEDCAAALILLCDQPLVNPAHVQALLEAWAAAPQQIAAAAYAGTIGVPAVIPAQYFPEIMQLGGDRGARALLERHAARVSAVPLPEAELDIDTQEDYALLIKRSG